MLGRRDPQRSFFGAICQLGIETVEKMGFYGKLGINLGKVFRDDEFARCYCERMGRPSVPPSVLAGARLLQHYDGVSDREVVDRCRFDSRWKVALDLDLASIEAPFARSTFQAFRARLTLHAAEGAAFERSVRAAKEQGILPRRLTVALDSSPVRGKGAVKDTFNLLSDAIAGVIRAVARERGAKAAEVSAEAGLERHIEAASIKGSEIVDWDEEQQVRSFLGGLIEDCKKAIELAEAGSYASNEVDLLKRVVDQDVETDDDGPRIKQGVAKGRMPSVTDPEMRHGHKSSGKAYSGHKAHLAVDTDSGIVTGLGIGAPGTSDGSQLQELVEQSQATTGSQVEEVLGDTAYASREAVRQAEESEVKLTTKMPSPAKGKLGPRDFKVSQDRRHAECPAGHESTKRYHRHDVFLHQWSPDVCGSCSLKHKCTRGNAKHRTLTVAPDFHDRRQREKYANSLDGRLHLRKRIVVEHAFGRIKNLGAGTARYFGQLKTLAQWQWTAAVVNLTIVWGQQAAVTA